MTEKLNCHGCRFARELDWKGNVRCAKAEELFGGKRFVTFKEEATCGTYEPFKGDDSTAPEPPETAPKVKISCANCAGTGFVQITFYDKKERMKCHGCEGTGRIEQGGVK